MFGEALPSCLAADLHQHAIRHTQTGEHAAAVGGRIEPDLGWGDQRLLELPVPKHHWLAPGKGFLFKSVLEGT